MRLEEIGEQDRNRLPYRVLGAGGELIRVRFEPLVQSDYPELTREPWSRAVFREVWPEFVEYPRALKLVFEEGEPKILGLVRLGESQPGLRFLIKNLLETNPEFVGGEAVPVIRGVGRALVARLVAESYARGFEGQVRVKSHRNAVGFYVRLGFKKNTQVHGYGYDLLKDKAAVLFESVTKK